MDKLKYIKLENEDGSYSSSIPLAVDSDYVDVNGNTLTNELSKKAAKNELDTQKARIDNLAHLSEGSTTGDAELIDSRIDSLGNEFISLGEHIRIKERVEQSFIFKNIYQGDFIKGTYDANGVFHNSSTAISTRNFIKYNSNYKNIYIYIDSEVAISSGVFIYYFDIDKNFIGLSGAGKKFNNNTPIVLRSDISYYKIGLGNQTGIAPKDINSFIISYDIIDIETFEEEPILKINNYEGYKEIINKLSKNQYLDCTSLVNYNGYRKTDGTLVPDENWITCNYLLGLLQGTTISYNIYTYSSIKSLRFLDIKGAEISSFTNSEGFSKGEIESPEGAYFLQFTLSAIHNDEPQYIKMKVAECDSDKFYEHFLASNLCNLCTNVGFIHRDGTIIKGDTNWAFSDLIPVIPGDEIKYGTIIGHSLVRTITIFDENKNVIDTIVADTKSSNKSVWIPTGSYTFSNEARYIQLCIYNPEDNSSYGINHYIYYIYNHSLKEILDSCINDINTDDKESKELPTQKLYPTTLYTVINNLDNKKGRSRNYSASIYLDHFFNGVEQEELYTFDNNLDKKIFCSPLAVIDANESNPGVTYNEGKNILEKEYTIGLLSNNQNKANFSLKHRSVLANMSTNSKPRILCIGDSITYGEQATVPDDNFTLNHSYSLQAKELFKMDAIDGNNDNLDALFLGIYQRIEDLQYNDNTYSITANHEGRRGWSYNTYYSSTSPFYNSETGKFSLNKWLTTYRTLDDNGNRLTLGEGTGTAITSSNLNTINVCVPTHIVIMLGANGGQTSTQYLKMVEDIHEEYPNIIIGLGVSDGAGTYFPRFHRNIPDSLYFWNNNNASRHNVMYTCMKNITNTFNTTEWENQKVYILPFYFVQPTAESSSFRNIPDFGNRFSFDKEDTKNIVDYGWGAVTHINGLGHAAWAYQLYSWIRYTQALEQESNND